MPGVCAISSQPCQGPEQMTDNLEDAVIDHGPTKKVLEKVAKLQAEIDALESDRPDDTRHRYHRTSDLDDVDLMDTTAGATNSDPTSGDAQGSTTPLDLQSEKVQLLDEMHRRQESYMRREDKLRSRVEELEAEVAQLKIAEGVSSHDAQKEELRKDMETGIRQLLRKFSDHSTCMEHEELMKFRQQLQSVEEEIKKERAVLSSQQQAQVERMLRLQQELANTQALALKLETQNKAVLAEAQRMRTELKCQKAEQEEVLRQNLRVKRENEGLRATVEGLRARFEAVFAERDELRGQLEAVGSGSGREHAVQAEHARAMDNMRRIMAAERARTKAAQSANLAMQAKQGELQEVLRSLVDRVQSQHDASTEALTQTSSMFGRSSPPRRRSPVRARSASGRRSAPAESSRCSLERKHSLSASEFSGGLPGGVRAGVYLDGSRRPASAAERSMQSAPLPMASEARLRRPASAVDRVGHGRIHGGVSRRPASAAEMPRSTRVAGGVVSVSTTAAPRPRSAFVARGSGPLQPVGDMLDRAMAGSRLFHSRSAGQQKARKAHSGWPGQNDMPQAHTDQLSKGRVGASGYAGKKDLAEQRRDKRQNGSKIETIVEEELLDGDEENVIEEQLDVSWQPVA